MEMDIKDPNSQMIQLLFILFHAIPRDVNLNLQYNTTMKSRRSMMLTLKSENLYFIHLFLIIILTVVLSSKEE